MANFTVLETLSSSNVSSSVGFTKTRAFAVKSCQNISNSVGFTKIRAFAGKCGQNISTSVGFPKSRAFTGKCGQNCANLLCRHNISRASPENKIKFEKFIFSFLYIKIHSNHIYVWSCSSS